MGLLECLYNMAAGFPENKCSKGELGKRHGVFYDLAEKSHSIISTVSYWLHRSALFFIPTQRHPYQEPGTMGRLGDWLPQGTLQGL